LFHASLPPFFYLVLLNRNFMDTPNASNNPQDSSSSASYPRYNRSGNDRPRSRWWIPLVVVLVIIFGFFALIAGVVFSLGSAFDKKTVTVKENSVLLLNISEAIEERTGSNNAIASLFDDSDKSPSFLDVLSGIKRAKTDANIRGIYIKGGVQAGGAKLAEIRSALEEFKQSGKFIYAFIGYGAERDYYIASVADSIFMPTEGLLEMNGYSVVGAFFKGTLEKIGVDYYVEQFEEYKSAVEPYTRTSFSEPAKQEVRELLESRSADFVATVAKSRSMRPEAVRAVLARGVYTPDSLLALGFIDGIRGETTLRDAMKSRLFGGANAGAKTNAKTNAKDTTKNTATSDDAADGRKLRLVSLASYVGSDSYTKAGESGKADDDKQIALVIASGTIVTSGDEDDQVVSTAFIKNLRKARDNSKVKAIIIRIDSPGGSVYASDEMWEEIRKVSAQKPVYASMSDVAASGGYYMAMACDTIVAHPNTITGSIGVLLMIPQATRLISNIGVTVDTVVTSPSAIIYDPSLPFTDANKARLHEQSGYIYQRFVSRVAASRHRSYDEIRAVAKGRVWTGTAARGNGLVDTLGGLYTAIGIAKRRIGIADSVKVSIHRYPDAESNRFERFAKRVFGDDDDEASAEERTPSSNIIQQLENRVSSRMLEKNAFWKALPESVRSQLLYVLELGEIAGSGIAKERTLMALPRLLDIQ
jgi:protease IV